MANEITFWESAGNAWGAFKTDANNFVESQNFEKLLIALTVIGVVGAAAVAVGATSAAAQAGLPVSDPTGMFNSLGNGAIGFMVAGGVLSVLGIICVSTLIKRLRERKTVDEAVKASDANRERARQESRAFLQYTQEAARELQPYQFRVFDEAFLGQKFEKKNKSLFESSQKYYVILSSTEDKFREEIIPESKLQQTVAFYKGEQYSLIA